MSVNNTLNIVIINKKRERFFHDPRAEKIIPPTFCNICITNQPLKNCNKIQVVH